VRGGASPTASAAGLPPDSIGAVLTRDGARIAAALGLSFAEGYREALGFLAGVMKSSRAGVTARHREAIPAATRAAYDALVDRRSRGEPYAYLIASREFYGLDFLVTSAVLIPRPETELLVEAALERLPVDAARTVLDLGTGSGVLAICIARLRPLAEITAVDASADALSIARTNANRLAADRIRFKQGSWYAPVAGLRFDLIVSNPPYVASGDPHMFCSGLLHEPRVALDGGPDGLQCVREIVGPARDHLEAGGWLLLEHGYDQAGRCRDLLAANGFGDNFSLRDLAGIERVSGGRIESV